MKRLSVLRQKIIGCRRCPRLVHYLAEIRKQFPTYWCRPVPAFGDPRAQILLIGLAPGRFGSNRTGRMFTGDGSGDFLYPVLYEVGLATQPRATAMDDGLELKNAFITAVIRCAPPKNKPRPEEIKNCRSYLEEEVGRARASPLLPNLRVVVAFGKIAHDEYVKIRLKQENMGAGPASSLRLRDFPFAHGALYRFKKEPRILIDTYHPSRQNTNTGRLTKRMFLNIFRTALHLLS